MSSFIKDQVTQNHTPLIRALSAFSAKRPVYFCIPGHRYEEGIPESFARNNLFRYDLTEAPGLDDLHQPRGVIREAERLTAGLFGSKETRFLVNGSTCGIEAAILATVSEGEKILVPRNVHRSVVSGLILSGADPVWILPDCNELFGFAGELSARSVERVLQKNPDIRAALMVSPSYYGVISDVSAIAAACHARHIPLIVDEAHGSHRYFARTGNGALCCGADVSVMSFHKTLNALTQSSVLHVQGDLVDLSRIDAALKMLMSSSPSYLLMASLDAVRKQMALHGEELTEKAEQLSFSLRRSAEEAGYAVFGGSTPASARNARSDPSRVVISAANAGMTGFALKEILFSGYNIAVEMADEYNIVCVVTSSNSETDIAQMAAALCEIRRASGQNTGSGDSTAAGKDGTATGKDGTATGKDGTAAGKDGTAAGKSAWQNAESSRQTSLPDFAGMLQEDSFPPDMGKTQSQTPSPLPKVVMTQRQAPSPLPEAVMTPRRAFFAESTLVDLSRSAGRICGETIVAYPPGIPLFCPGEVIDEDTVRILSAYAQSETVISKDSGPDNHQIKVLLSKTF